MRTTANLRLFRETMQHVNAFTAQVNICLYNVCANKRRNDAHKPAQAGQTGLEMLSNERFQALKDQQDLLALNGKEKKHVYF